MKVENIEVFNLKGALRGMRNPLESWESSDSYYDNEDFIIGERDLKRAQSLIKAGSDERKFMRQILVSMDITASMSFWWDIDTYKIATEKNSTSRMHKFTGKNCGKLTQKDFNWSYMTDYRETVLEHVNELIDNLKCLTEQGAPIISEIYQKVFEELVNDLPDGYLFTRHWTGNYEVLLKLYNARKNHKQREIRDFCSVISNIPYAQELIILEKR